MVLRISTLGRKSLFSRPAGSESQGIRYAFTQGMMPSAKESVRMHQPTFIAGLLYHTGVFAAAFNLLLALLHVPIPPAMVLIIRVVMLVGFISGIALLIKRLAMPKMRIISTPDDVIANIIVDLFLATSIAFTMSKTLEPWLLGISILLLLYIPIGKIRHCVFFFVTRLNFGRLFGRRGVLPHAAERKQVNVR
ncbi:hypothetical protein C3F09_06095 [candidate division GN15 bacterium]|uniref:Uncharacterized protein n=1 Tax=candidate division GN15 bacterium TaxID=2072418 RepID=A0A855X7A2_9BACT|nr:MAG: hypothetical protein C3F09_06095 [candidate division GN15 bacterium]